MLSLRILVLVSIIQTVAGIEWRQAGLPPAPDGVTVAFSPDGIRLDFQRPGEIRLVGVTGWQVTAPRFALRGRVRHERLTADSFVQVDWHFADGASYFTRTAAVVGAMRVLRGDSGWREILLPFDASGARSALTGCTITLIAGSAGVIELSNLDLLLDDAAVPWWSRERVSFLAGLLAGAGIVIIFVVFVVLLTRLNRRRELRRRQELDAAAVRSSPTMPEGPAPMPTPRPPSAPDGSAG